MKKIECRLCKGTGVVKPNVTIIPCGRCEGQGVEFIKDSPEELASRLGNSIFAIETNLALTQSFLMKRYTLDMKDEDGPIQRIKGITSCLESLKALRTEIGDTTPEFRD